MGRGEIITIVVLIVCGVLYLSGATGDKDPSPTGDTHCAMYQCW